MTSPSFRDIESISAYLDGRLTETERTRLEARLSNDPELSAAHQSLREARNVLRRLPQRRVPRNFTLTPRMAGVKSPAPRTYPLFRFASAFAALTFFFSMIAPGVSRVIVQSAAAPMAAVEGRGMGGGGGDPSIDQNLPPYSVAEAAPVEEDPAAASTQMALMPTPEIAGKEPAQDFTTEPVADPDPAPVLQGWQWSLLALAAVFGGVAYFVRWRADQQFEKRYKKTR